MPTPHTNPLCQNEVAEYKEGDAMNPVDLCIIFLGMNDCIAGGMAGKDAEAIAGYKKLIDIVRSRRGSSVPILCLYPDANTVGGAPNLAKWSRMIKKGFHVNVKRWVTGAVALTGGEDSKIFARQVKPTQQILACGDDDFGMGVHLNVEGGRKFSTGVIPLVCDMRGGPSWAQIPFPRRSKCDLFQQSCSLLETIRNILGYRKGTYNRVIVFIIVL